MAFKHFEKPNPQKIKQAILENIDDEGQKQRIQRLFSRFDDKKSKTFDMLQNIKGMLSENQYILLEKKIEILETLFSKVDDVLVLNDVLTQLRFVLGKKVGLIGDFKYLGLSLDLLSLIKKCNIKDAEDILSLIDQKIFYIDKEKINDFISQLNDKIKEDVDSEQLKKNIHELVKQMIAGKYTLEDISEKGLPPPTIPKKNDKK